MTWKQKMDYIIENADKIHKWYSIENGWCYLSDKYGNRYKITNTSSLWDINDVINRINAVSVYNIATINK